MERRHGDIAVGHGVMVRLGAARPVHGAAADPEDLAPPGVLHARQRLAEVAAAERGDLDALHAGSPAGGKVHVEDHLGREVRHRHDALHQAREEGLVAQDALEVAARPGEGDRHARDAKGDPFHGRRDGAGVEHVLAHVGPVVHAAEHETRTVGHQGAQGQEHAVGGRAIHLEAAVGAAGGPQRPVHGQAVRGAALLAIGRHDGHLPHRLAALREQRQAGRQDPVVVGHQDVHGGQS